jgi:hypothetical protein
VGHRTSQYILEKINLLPLPGIEPWILQQAVAELHVDKYTTIMNDWYYNASCMLAS